MSTKNAGSSEPTYQLVWDTLSKVDVNDHKKSKGGLSYLSWAWAWGALMEHYPQATYEFFDEARDDLGHVEVWCKVKIGELERVMWLPVMDFKNNAMKNPDLRKISDTRMRCLTKCIGMFGLGHYIYAGEDLPSGPDEPEPEPEKVAEKKPAPVKKPQAKPKVQLTAEREAVVDASFGVHKPSSIGDAEEAANVVTFLIGAVDQFASESFQQLKEFYGDNKQVIDLLDSQYPEQYAKLKDHLSALKAKLQEQAA